MVTLILFIILCTNLIINCILATCVSTINVGDQLNLTSQLLSPRSHFTLGFFTISATKHTYLGIQYTGSQSAAAWDTYDTVWVGNPSTPIMSTSVVLMINPDTGKLIISTGGTTLVNISDNGYIISSPNLTATLDDNGNFQLKNKIDGRTLWQSFDYPTNVLLPGMKLGVDLTTGRSWNLTSWLSDKIPHLGAFTLSWEPTDEASQRFMIRRRGQPYWTSGNLDNQRFPSMYHLNGPYGRYKYNLSYVYNNEQRYFSFHGINGVQPMWVLSPGGYVFDVDNSAVWTPIFCYGYHNLKGCIVAADSNMFPCRSENEEFRRLRVQFDPHMTNELYDNNSSLSISDCMVRCWNDCNCLGFVTGSNGTGCVTWTGTKSVNNYFFTKVGSFSPEPYVLVSPNPGKASLRNRKKKNWIWAPIVAAIILLLICLGLLWYLKKSKLRREVEERQKKEDEYFLELIASDGFKDATNLKSNGKRGSDLMVYSFAAIVAATKDFSSENKLGQGGFGPVYKGKLSDGQEIAVKRLSRTSGQGLVEFKNELVLIAKLLHTNLVRILGCCIHGEEKMLVYEYMSNKSLDFFLFEETRKVLLDWPKRWNIIEGVAQGLLYLHKYSIMRVIHRDLKASNILLDESMNPKISDFGMARMFKEDETHAMTNRVVGTYGYMAPEYAMEGTFSVKSDVFSFGVLTLEIVSGRRNTSFSHLDRTVNLIEYAWELWLQGDALELEDRTLADSHVINQLLRTIHVALLCIQENPLDRPVMSDVISMLKSDTKSLPAPKRPAFLFGRTMFKSTLAERKPENCSMNNMTITSMEAQ